MKHPLSELRPVLSLDEVNVLREAAHGVYIDPLLRRWAIRLVRATREAEGVAIGASVRGSLALERSARAWALLSGREFVTPVDIERLFLPVVMHRIVFTPELRRNRPRDRLAGGGGGVQATVPRDRAATGGGAGAGGVCMRSRSSLLASPRWRRRPRALSSGGVTLSLRQYKNANKVRVLVVWYGQVAGGRRRARDDPRTRVPPFGLRLLPAARDADFHRRRRLARGEPRRRRRSCGWR